MMTDHLAGEISAEDKSALDSHLASCETCRKEFEQLKEIWTLTESALKADSFNDTLHPAVHEKILNSAKNDNKKPGRIIKFSWLELAAGITIVIILTGIFAPSISKMMKTGLSNKTSGDYSTEEIQLNQRPSPKISPTAVPAPVMSPSAPASATVMEKPMAPMKAASAKKSMLKDEKAVPLESRKLEMREEVVANRKDAMDVAPAAKGLPAPAATQVPKSTPAAMPEGGMTVEKKKVLAETIMPTEQQMKKSDSQRNVMTATAGQNIVAKGKASPSEVQSEANQPAADAAASDKLKQTEIALDGKQKLMLKRVTELLKESKHWYDYPLKAVRFDAKRNQWEFQFTDMKPDSGVFAYIKDENAEEIDILLFPPTWTKYKRK